MAPLAPARRRPRSPRPAPDAPAGPLPNPFPPSDPAWVPPPPHRRDAPVAHGVPCSLRDCLDRYGSPAGVEWVDGFTHDKPVVSNRHQSICAFLYDALRDRVRADGDAGQVRFNGQDLLVPRPDDGEIVRLRHPDVCAMLDRDDPRVVADGWLGCDVCVEVISPDDPRRDTVQKRAEYAAAGVAEYWLVDPRPSTRRLPAGRTVSILSLAGGEYTGEPVGDGGAAESLLLPGLRFDVTACLDAV